ncbi:hypothetical protein KY290_005705 [Solanum tuberosum]|uniref:Uncharacterized protein n=1 Tax=Solanum tuberosum TaxID=4113 RepID=A0ABQ7WGR9_SOLTU|nr:hypothetical protein KY284_005754 [Solanum tuberosum]KAH0723036.1 hypothetical protein KY289_006080 [Solanum tuberosum]KAH0752449.1 hypothetical protein KY285_005597 [Solanum tuberosum]KAH0779278.1 hypothetical protein KY290_005705 [Solanum tuberosum]
MNLASIIHNNSTQLPPKFHKISPISSPSTSPKWLGVNVEEEDIVRWFPA